MVSSRESTSAAANRELYDAGGGRAYFNAAPHLKHRQTRQFHQALIERVYANAAQKCATVRLLDIGAGEGSSAYLFLRLGAYVTAVDVSEYQLNQLRARCREFGPRLSVRHEDVWETLNVTGSYDIVVANSFLHHVPDYLELIRRLLGCIAAGGQFFSFQDPLRYDTLGRASYLFSQASYFAWRLFQGNLWEGLKTRIRRARGIYIAGSRADDAEYHVTRNGVDHAAICALLEANGFDCELMRYFSTQGAVLQEIGSRLGFTNTFAVLARRRS